MRRLASIQSVSAVENIIGADKIEKITVLGWQLVAKKNEFKVGDAVVYCEIDSVLPPREEFEFLKPHKYRIRTSKFRGCISQGIAFPLSILPSTINKGVALGDDVTELLGVTQYLPPIPVNLSGEMKGAFPSFVPKTDETRVQVLQKVLDKFKGTPCYISEKVDGSSCTFFINNDEFGVCSRNWELKETAGNTFWKVARELNIEEKLRGTRRNLALQGELIGQNINGNNLKIAGHKVLFYNVYDIDAGMYLRLAEFQQMIEDLDLETVPIINTDFQLPNSIPSLVELATAKSALNKEAWREGIVIRPRIEIATPEFRSELGSDRLSFKVINPEYLLKYE